MELNKDMKQVQLLTTKCVVNKLVKPPLEIVDACTQTIIPDPLEVKLSICNDEVIKLTKEVQKYKEETIKLSSVLSKIQIKEMWSRKVISDLNKSVTEYEQKLQEKEATISNNMNEISFLNEYISEYQHKLLLRDSEITEIKTELNSNNEHISKLNLTIYEKNQKYNELKDL